MKNKRKRRPGGGRKPKGSIRGKTEVFATRITPQTRLAIESEAGRSGQSVSQVAEQLLALGLDERRRRSRNAQLKAVGFLIEQIALGVGFVAVRWPSTQIFDNKDHTTRSRDIEKKWQDMWRKDPFRYQAFTLAVSQLLEALKPKGEIKLPLEIEIARMMNESAPPPAVRHRWEHKYKSPENLAASVFADVWSQLFEENISDVEREVSRLETVGEKRQAEMRRLDFYAMQDARRDLKSRQTGGAVMKGHVRERGAGNWYAVIDLRDPTTGKRKRKWHSLEAKGKREAQIECARLISD